MKEKIGIVGGTGKTGLQFAKFFKSKGYQVFISHYNLAKAKKIAESNRLKALTNEELAKNCDIIFFSVPMSKTERVIKQLAPLARPGTLLSDFTSVKEMPINAMLKYSNPKIEVIGLHPMFGPVVDIKGQNIVVVPARGKEFIPWIKKIFKEAKLIFSTAKEHDEMMAIVQCLVHFPSIVTAMVMKKMKVNLSRVEKFSTPIYRARRATIKRILSQDPELYGDIEMLNKNSEKVINELIKSANDLHKIIKRKNMNKFVKEYNAARNYIKKFQ